MQEKRKYIRYAVEGSVILKPEDGASGSIKADLADNSFIGAGFFAKEKIETGTNVSFEFTLKLWDRPVTGKGKIKYVHEVKRLDNKFFRMGIEFIDIHKETIRSIINHIQAYICAAAKKRAA
jgi:hypothetical protein